MTFTTPPSPALPGVRRRDVPWHRELRQPQPGRRDRTLLSCWASLPMQPQRLPTPTRLGGKSMNVKPAKVVRARRVKVADDESRVQARVRLLSPEAREAARLEIRQFPPADRRSDQATGCPRQSAAASRIWRRAPEVARRGTRRPLRADEKTPPEDRVHRDAGVRVQLSQMPPLEHDEGTYVPDWLEVGLRQQEGDAAADVELLHNELDGECRLTLAEANELARVLQAVVAVAQGT